MVSATLLIDEVTEGAVEGVEPATPEVIISSRDDADLWIVLERLALSYNLLAEERSERVSWIPSCAEPVSGEPRVWSAFATSLD